MKLKPFLIIAILLILTSFAYAGNSTIYYFYGRDCPHCAKATPFLKEMQDKYPINVEAYETWYNKANAKLLTNISDTCGIQIKGVPAIFIGSKAIIGFDDKENKGAEIEKAIIEYIDNPDIDLMQHLGEELDICNDQEIKSINVPFIGKLDPTKLSLPMLTVIIGLLDGFNPCAMWALLFLLTLLVYTKSRKKMFIIGGTFILVSGIMYYIFMAAWLNFFLLVGFLPFLRLIIGLVAITVGLINVKELFFFKKGVSLTIADKTKSKLLVRMRKIINESSLPLALISVSVLAVTVNTVELLCTAGFPAIYTSILALNNLNPIQYYSYILGYIIMYMFDDMIVFTIAVFTLGSKKLTEKQGRWMKFIAGFMMLVLGALLIFKPELLVLG